MPSAVSQSWWTQRRISERLASPEFQEAAITAGFLIAAADGEVSADEYDVLLDRLELLADLDRDLIDERLTTAARSLEAAGYDPTLARVGELIMDPEAGEAALMLALATALADQQISPEERETAGRLAEAVGLTAADVDGLVTELRA